MKNLTSDKISIERIVIIGAVGTALNIIEQINNAIKNYSYRISLEGIVIDTILKGEMIAGVPVIGGLDSISGLLKDPELKFIFALFKPEKMKERFELLRNLNIPAKRYANFVHPVSYQAGSLIMGKGNVILSNSTIQSNVAIGDFNIINSNVTIEHDTIIGNGNFFAANSCIGSNVNIGNHCFIGLNSSIRENVRLGENVFVGMHSLVLRDFTNCIVAGVPAKLLK